MWFTLRIGGVVALLGKKKGLEGGLIQEGIDEEGAAPHVVRPLCGAGGPGRFESQCKSIAHDPTCRYEI